MKNYFDSHVFSYREELWNLPTSRLNGISAAQQQVLGHAWHETTGLSPESIHWCSGLWLLLGDTASGKTTLQTRFLNALNSQLRIWHIGEPGDPIFPYDDKSWNLWCTALAFTDDFNSDQLYRRTLYSHTDTKLLQETNADAEYCLIEVLKGDLRAYDFDSARRTLQALARMSTNSDNVKLYQQSLADLREFQIDKKTGFASYADQIEKRLPEADSTLVDLDTLHDADVVIPASHIVMIDSLTQLPFKQSVLSYTTGGLAIDVFKAMAQLDYIARIKSSVVLATFNPTIFSRQIMTEFVNAVPGLATGSIFVRTTDNPDFRNLDVSSRDYVEQRDPVNGTDLLKEIRYHDSFTYSLTRTEADVTVGEEDREEDYAPADFY